MDDSYVSSVSGAQRDSRIDGLDGTRGLAERRDGVMELGVDSVTVDNNVVVGRVSGRPMDEGPGKDGGIELRDLVEDTGRRGRTAGLSDGNSLPMREGLDTDPGSGMSLALTLVALEVVVGMLPISEGELTVEVSSRA